ncbi:hypothetical protein ACQP2P_01460 [Dactylosporangium sp. CA-139114]|uniref:hypothetical protein n=1 Tax=Dactylosporangium sp. CA-139114 TaxID=3239931 RepID=UPI003D984462
MSNPIDPAALVVVANLKPLQDFHAPAGDHTACGYRTHGWFPLTATAARANACAACPACFPAAPGR